ncbi:MAG TPA: hypothetical protein VME45_21110 [Stellaceae bacterium]|nr:hypothetical protein [Stellaceae bacterium]
MPKTNQPRIAVYDMTATEWVPSGPPGVEQQNIRNDIAAGRWFGGVRFAPLARSGVHRHLGPVGSYMLSGSLVDHVTRMIGGQAVINLTGAVHDVICYDASMFIARVDGPILYPRHKTGVLNELGREADSAGESIDATVGAPSDICIEVETLAELPGPVSGVARRALFDYAGQPHVARYSQILLAPGTEVPAHTTTAMTDLFVLSGEIRAGDEAAGSGCYVTIDPEAEMTLTSRYGARVLAWADGPVRWLDGASRGDLYGW